MKKRYKICIGEWLTIYQHVVGTIDSDEVPTEENIERLIKENGIDYECEDLDWTSAETQSWDTFSFKVIEDQGEVLETRPVPTDLATQK